MEAVRTHDPWPRAGALIADGLFGFAVIYTAVRGVGDGWATVVLLGAYGLVGFLDTTPGLFFGRLVVRREDGDRPALLRVLLRNLLTLVLATLALAAPLVVIQLVTVPQGHVAVLAMVLVALAVAEGTLTVRSSRSLADHLLSTRIATR